MKTAIITGATGFIGSELTKELSRNGIEIFAVCRPNSINLQRIQDIPGVHILELPLSELNQLPERIGKQKVDSFYHIAWDGTFGTERSELQRQISNISYCGLAATAAAGLRCEKIVVTGTVYENLYPQICSLPHYAKIAVYVLCKVAAYNLLTQHCKALQLPLIWCQICQPIGMAMRPEQVISLSVKEFLQGRSLPYNSGNQLFDLLPVEDLTHALHLIGKHNIDPGKYYVTSQSPKPLRTYITRIRDIVNASVPINFNALADDGFHWDSSWFSDEKLPAAVGYVPTHNWEETIRSYASLLA